MDKLIFTSLAGQNAGAVLSSNFFALDFAADANDYIIFDTFNKTLYYDADGSGVGAEVVVARIFQSGGNTLAASDFILA